MDTDKRLQMIRIVEAVRRYPEFGKKLGLTDKSTYHGVKLVDERNSTPPSNS